MDGLRAKVSTNPALAAVVDHFDPLLKEAASAQQ